MYNKRMDNLFELSAKREKPLAERMRPVSLDDFYGQEHIVGEGTLLRRAIQTDTLGSCIFYGPPGCGKTTLANIIANAPPVVLAMILASVVRPAAARPRLPISLPTLRAERLLN